MRFLNLFKRQLKVDHLIIGQGLAGTLLAWHLLERGRRVLVVDRDESVTSSKVAAGLVTPISGQQFSLPEDLAPALAFAKQTYWDIEERLGQQFFHHLRIARLFKNETESTQWYKRLSDPVRRDRYRDFYTDLEIDRNHFHANHGGIEIKQGGWLDVAALIEAMRIYLLERLAYAVGRVHSRDLELLASGGVKWRNITAGNAIFCEGWKGSENHFFEGIPMNNARGDILRLSCGEITNESRILNRNGWIIPLGDGVFRAGASYDHHFKAETPTTEGRHEVEIKVGGILKPEFEVIGHEAAVRPIIRRSQVFLGRHPRFPEIAYFNGLGSKGVINAPSKTLALVEHLLSGVPLDKSVDIQQQFYL